MYYIYMIRCKDESIYTGITTDIQRRMKEHAAKGKKCAKYTLNHDFKKIEIAWETNDRKQASKLEYHIKTLSRIKKEELIIKNNLDELLGTKIEAGEYKRRCI